MIQGNTYKEKEISRVNKVNDKTWLIVQQKRSRLLTLIGAPSAQPAVKWAVGCL